MTWHFERVAGPFSFTEGPVWDGHGVLFTDIPNDRILRYDPRTGTCAVWRRDTHGANGLALDARGRLYACEGDARRIVRYEPDGRTVVVADRFEGLRFNSPNDLTFDAAGRLWFSDPRYGDRMGVELTHDSIYRVDDPTLPSQPIRMTYDTTRPNGLAVSHDGRTLYVAQSEYGEGNPRELRAYAIAAEGSLGLYTVLHDFYPHRGIDGMCLDADGCIVAAAGWAESGPGPMIYVLAPDGRVLEAQPVPVDRPSNCAFGGPEFDTLYVTAGGCLFAARTGRRGRMPA